MSAGAAGSGGGSPAPLLSVVTPAYNESANLPVLHKRLLEVMEQLGCTWEWIVVDDHSRDATFEVVRGLAASDPRVRGLRLARNSGSHVAISCGLKASRGDAAVFLAADLQDPPEVIAQLMEKWRDGAQIVWAVRARREGIKAHMLMFARLYYWIMRRIIGMKNMPATGADFFFMDRQVIDAFCQFREANISILALITWMGYRQDHVDYVKEARLYGASGWTLPKMLKLVADSVTSFSYVPIRLMSYTGFVFAAAGFLYGLVEAIRWLVGEHPGSWAPVVFVVLVVGGVQILFLGMLGEYIWRALDESRRRPRFLIEDATPQVGHLARDAAFLE